MPGPNDQTDPGPETPGVDDQTAESIERLQAEKEVIEELERMKGTPATAAEILNRNRRTVESRDGDFVVRRVPVAWLVAAGVRYPGGQHTRAAGKKLPKRRPSTKSEKTDVEIYTLYLQTLITRGVIREQVTSGVFSARISWDPDKHPTDLEKNVINVADLHPETVEAVILKIEDLSGYDVHKKAIAVMKGEPEESGGFSPAGGSGALADVSEAGQDPVGTDAS